MARHRAAHESGLQPDADASDAGARETTDVDTGDTDMARTKDTTDEDTMDADGNKSGGTDNDAEDNTADEVPAERTAEADSFWSDVRVDPVEIALPSGVGYTLRAYRAPADLGAVEGDEPEADDEAGAAGAGDAEPAAGTVTDGGSDGERSDAEASDEAEDDDDEADEPEDDEAEAEADEDEDEDEAELEEPAEPDEVPVFLTQRGRLLLFHEPQALVEFLRSDETHALLALDTAEELARRIHVEYVVPAEEDHYELDLLVENLRRGHDVWEPELIVKAGELARDLGYALRLDSVLTALAGGSPLDDLDEAARTATSGGFSGFLARRRMKKIAPQQAALAWRTIIGKIRGAVDWRE